MEKSSITLESSKASQDHIALTLSTAGSSLEDSTLIQPTRKSLRRTWNQLPRCQRNLIILGVMALCITLLLFLPGDPIVSESNRQATGGSGGIFPFQAERRDAGIGEGADALKSSKDVLRNDFVPPDVHNGNKLDDSDAVKHDKKADLYDADGTQNEAPQFKELKIKTHVPPVLNIENVVKLPETQKSDYASDIYKDNDDKVNIQEIHLNNNNIEAPAAQHSDSAAATAEQDTDRDIITAAVQDPEKVPGLNDVTIDEFLLRLENPMDAQKHHFHGATNERQSAVVAAFKHSWEGYRKYAWGHDNLKPISQSSHDWFGLGLTVVDALDTMYIMGLEDEFKVARDWVSDFLTFESNRDVNLFETTIRILGGLLASYHLSGDSMFLKKSIELGNRLLPCFLSPSGIPYSDVNLATMSAHSPKWSPDSSTSEVTTIQLEFRDLSRSINIPIYERVTQAVNEKVHELEKNNGLVPIFINANTGTFRSFSTISLGARGDSYYEYLLKQWIQTGCKDNDVLILDYMRAIDGVLTQLMRRTPREHHVYIGELINGKEFKPKMDHLTCYLPGTLILGHRYGMPDSHLLLARDLLETCYQTYMKQPTQLAPEISYFGLNANEDDIYVKPNDAHNLLRPEFIESLYYFYALTGNHTYQDMGWNIFQAFEKHTKVAAGYTSIGNVKNIFNTRLRDMMESFWLGETLKYFYLLFSDNRKEINLDKWIFNTEAHPLPIRNH